MKEKELAQRLYRTFREDSNRNTEICCDVLRLLHERNELVYLEDMEDLSGFERMFIKYLQKKYKNNNKEVD